MSAANPISEYLSELQKNLAAGNATEHTHRPALKTLVETLEPTLTAVNEPSRIQCGAPDFIITRGKIPIGYIETKDIGANLQAEERSDQMRRYREALSNLILTDYLEFRWYVQGEHRETARLGAVAADGKIKRSKDGAEAVARLFQQSFTQQVPTIGTPKDLAQRMAAQARLIRDLILGTFEREAEGGSLHGQLAAFRETLIPDLSPAQFADMYAQTIAYGLFAARVRVPTGHDFTREKAAWDLPKTNPFLRKLFGEIAGPDLDERIAWLVDDLAQLLARADMAEVLRDFGKRTKQEDPVVHFYETFLAAYDPALRERRGVYYTPEPVVSYIVRSIDHILKTRFNRPLGLADPNTLILDPAVGTATFLYFVIQQVHDAMMGKGQEGGWSGYVKEHLLPRIFGFELLMAPYAMAHMKLGLQLQQTGYDFSADQRLGIYLTNTLEEAVSKAQTLGFAGYITEEANKAAGIKRDEPIMVVLGNPPYSGHSANRSWVIKDGKRVPTFIGQLIRDYYFVDGAPLGERNPKWLQDDYVKFIRWGQWRIEKTGAGVLALISNHGYLDNPTFRGMRQQLMRAFTDIYILDLHGNVKKKEAAPDGSKDENVFDIQQGVTIGIFVKERGKNGPARVQHADLWGLREGKYRQLFEADAASTPWKELSPKSPFYMFVPRDVNLQAEYDKGWKVSDVFPVNSVGVVTARDHLSIHWSRNEVWSTVQDFASLPVERAREAYNLGADTRDWKVHLAQQDIKSSGPDAKHIVPILYRAFDVRHTYYTGQTRGFICMPRHEVMRHMLVGKNLALVTVRKVPPPAQCGYFMCTRDLVSNGVIRSDNQSIDSLFPLYLYPERQKERQLPGGGSVTILSLLESHPEYTAPSPNLSPAFIAAAAKALGLEFIPSGKGDLQTTFGPEAMFHYIYAVFHSPAYRTRYAEFLKTDFPRVPLTSDRELFKTLAAKGEELVSLHLMESPGLNGLVTRFPVGGSNEVEKVHYVENPPVEEKPVIPPPPPKPYNHDLPLEFHEPRVMVPVPPPPEPRPAGRVYINKTQYFEGVAREVWEFQVGGYQVCDKWLKDRKGRKLLFDDLWHYQKIIVALKETIRLMEEIDEAIPEWPLV